MDVRFDECDRPSSAPEWARRRLSLACIETHTLYWRKKSLSVPSGPVSDERPTLLLYWASHTATRVFELDALRASSQKLFHHVAMRRAQAGPLGPEIRRIRTVRTAATGSLDDANQALHAQVIRSETVHWPILIVRARGEQIAEIAILSSHLVPYLLVAWIKTRLRIPILPFHFIDLTYFSHALFPLSIWA